METQSFSAFGAPGAAGEKEVVEDKPGKECNLLGAGLAGPSSASPSPQPGAGEEAP